MNATITLSLENFRHKRFKTDRVPIKVSRAKRAIISNTSSVEQKKRSGNFVERNPPLDDAATKYNGTTRATEMSYRASSTPPGGHMIYQHHISTRLFCFHKWWKEARPFSWWRVSPSPPKKHSIDPPNLHVVNKAKMVACCHDNGGWLCSSCKSREQAADGPAARVASLLTVRQQGNLCKSFNWQQRSHRNMIIAVNRAVCVKLV